MYDIDDIWYCIYIYIIKFISYIHVYIYIIYVFIYIYIHIIYVYIYIHTIYLYILWDILEIYWHEFTNCVGLQKIHINTLKVDAMTHGRVCVGGFGYTGHTNQSMDDFLSKNNHRNMALSGTLPHTPLVHQCYYGDNNHYHE